MRLGAIKSKLIRIQKDELKQHDGNKERVAKVLVILDGVITSRTNFINHFAPPPDWLHPPLHLRKFGVLLRILVNERIL